MTYKEKLKDRRWRNRRRQILVRDNFKCQICGYRSHHNHVHHLAYIKNTEPWDYPDYYLITLCQYCHENEHYIENEIKQMRLSGMLWYDIKNKMDIR
jgi:5-methylcytosine-specific restriction endonuclease McrA